ncbi:ECF RNA polymerase sigma factor SigK [Planctomonas sp. JC2975]|uniref:ECF RNA polymerase sigma factor SigK n=1 Tax=Planctomonas sp. JC2975 TaxID=2729626 RepID=UPI00147645B3|nr:ECF RNA polymerase sigma factor SigK [Planctomonas sp. JC2975]
MPVEPIDVWTDGAAESAEVVDRLLVRVAAGDQAAFGELYDVAAARVFGVVLRLVIDRSQAEEVAQEVFLEIWQSAGAFDPNRGRAIGWIMTVAKRRAIDRIRSAQAARDRDLRVGLADYHVTDDVADVAETLVESERVAGAMERLPEAQRQAIGLAYDGGLTHTEIAGLLGVPVGTVKTRLRDGMIRLRRELGVRA